MTELAQRVAQEVGGKVVAPIFTNEEWAKELTDFSDLHQSRGIEEVKKQLGLILQQRKGKSRDKFEARELSLTQYHENRNSIFLLEKTCLKQSSVF